MDMNKNAPLLETRDLKKYFKVGGGTLHAVDSVNIRLYQGDTGRCGGVRLRQIHPGAHDPQAD